MNDPRPRRVTCRYRGKNDDQCTAEATDPEGEILLCIVHLGRALKLLARLLEETE